MALTFTNKAGHEMRERIAKVVPYGLGGMMLGTFHSLAHRLLRLHHDKVGLVQSFQILDSEDQLRLIKRIMRQANIDDSRWPPRQVQNYINSNKDEGMRAQALPAARDPFNQNMLFIYQEYQRLCQQDSLVDFAELMLATYELLKKDNELRAHYQARIKHLLVDEFQDTNAIQYAWLKLFVGPDTLVTAVGDDDQAIYGWRGAKVENIHKFTKEFGDVALVRLEQNYRSTSTILAGANAVITNNGSRLGKSLWTQGVQGEPIALYAAFNDLDEARYIAATISSHVSSHQHNYQDMAILYRSNAQSRVLEEALIQERIPYRIYGGAKFFERAEIKDVMAYLRVLQNPDDSAALERAINWPTRGIGEKTLQTLRDYAREQQVSLYRALEAALEPTGLGLTPRALGCLQQFVRLLQSLKAEVAQRDLSSLVQFVIDKTGLGSMYANQRGEQAQSKLDNLKELVTASAEFKSEQDGSPLDEFIAHAALDAGEAQADSHTTAVQLMTLHAAKGLEFPVVFLSGMEERLFPHQMAIADGDRLEEERRLCYVGMTRAMQKLYLTYAESRRFHGKTDYQSPSRFLGEIPVELLQSVRMDSSGQAHALDLAPGMNEGGGLCLGQQVSHQKFGLGTVLAFEGSGEQLRIQVKFAVGTKWLVLSMANLTAV